MSAAGTPVAGTGPREGRLAAAVLVLVVAVACLALARTDVARLSGGRFWSDGATYHAMAHSLARDGDLRYEAKDVILSRREFAGGPQGIFLKRSFGGYAWAPERGFPWLRRVGPAEPRLYFAKPFLYPLVAAPFVAWLGTSGLLLTNGLALGLGLAAFYDLLRRQARPWWALGTALVLVGGTVAPLYALWLTPEAFGFGLISAALWAWRRERPWLSAVLFGLAGYAKPPNVLLALPLGLEPLWAAGPGWARRGTQVLARGTVIVAVAAALYAANWAVTGEANYQGGRERKTFYGRAFPLETHGVTFGNSGIWMSTNQLGPRIEGLREEPRSQGAEPPRTLDEVLSSFVHNLGYYWVGRFGGIVPYYFPLALAVLLLLTIGPRSRAALLALTALLVSQLAYILQIPDNWYGGSGTLGNRYFINVLPLALALVPRGREPWVALGGALGAAVFVAPLLAAPLRHALDPGAHTRRAPFTALPAELSMLNDLAVFGEPWRKKQPFGDTEGDPRRPGSADPRAYYLYFPDDGTYFKEQREGRWGFRLRAGQPAEVLLRALEPAARARLRLQAGTLADTVRARAGGGASSVHLEPGASAELVLELGRPFAYKATAVYVLRLQSTALPPATPESGPAEARGTFIELALEAQPR